MPGDYPTWGGHYPGEHTYGYAQDVYENRVAPQAEGLNQLQSHFDEDEYNYRGYNCSTGRSYWGDYIGGVAWAPSDVYDAYAQSQYLNGPSYTAWGSEYRDGGGDAAYVHSDYYEPTSNEQYYPDPHRFPNRGQQVVRAVPLAPSPPPTTRSPSPSYLSASLSPSTHTEAPLRKLLILDLNGTLLFRPKPPMQRRPFQAATPRNNPTSASQPVKRMVLARPYLACFREYLFHPSTKKWLDVMIWSSAQPHSVKDMLQQCFPELEQPQDGDGEAQGGKKPDDRFIAVWARDTLGLSRIDYSRKSQTTKDLHKPWNQLVVPRSTGQPDESSDDEHASLRHSAHTTLLLDDSPLKARLQPWNHVCLQEYDAEAREKDARAFKALLREQDGDTGKIHPKDVIQSPSLSGIPPRHDSTTPRLDATLLAVIGVLEGVKYESNVAGWIRAGGLWGETDEEKGATIRLVEHENRAAEHISLDPPSVGGMKHGRDADDSQPCPSPPAKRARGKSPQTPAVASLANHMGLPLDGTGSPSLRPSVIPPPPFHGPAPVDPGLRDDSGDVPRAEGDEAKVPTAELQTLWFTHAATFDYWVCQGRKVLRRLEIEEKHGVTVEE